MPVQITIRGVLEEVRDKLAARAALQRQSMQEFLRGELERIASRPSIAACDPLWRTEGQIKVGQVVVPCISEPVRHAPTQLITAEV